MGEATHTHTQTFDRHALRRLTRAETLEMHTQTYTYTHADNTHTHNQIYTSTNCMSRLVHKHSGAITVLARWHCSQKQERGSFAHMCKQTSKAHTNKTTEVKPSQTDNSTGSSSSERTCPYHLLFQLSGSRTHSPTVTLH